MGRWISILHYGIWESSNSFQTAAKTLFHNRSKIPYRFAYPRKNGTASAAPQQ
jgi:hypothetical protein